MSEQNIQFEPHELRMFVAESNRIEGIERDPRASELEASAAFLALPRVDVISLESFVAICQPGAKLRSQPGMNVFIGGHVPPPGGPAIQPALEALLDAVDLGKTNPYQTHVAYETLHPFTDGNGRSGRILWAWQMVRRGWHPVRDRSFLHEFYYQALQGVRSGE